MCVLQSFRHQQSVDNTKGKDLFKGSVHLEWIFQLSVESGGLHLEYWFLLYCRLNTHTGTI